MNNFLLYIDPGTGSMLFSILIGAAATLFFVAKAAWIKLKILLSGKKDGSGIVDASYKLTLSIMKEISTGTYLSQLQMSLKNEKFLSCITHLQKLIQFLTRNMNL